VVAIAIVLRILHGNEQKAVNRSKVVISALVAFAVLAGGTVAFFSLDHASWNN
jgi:hypothetical protein